MKLFLFASALLLSLAAGAQHTTVFQVLDAESGEPLIGAAIVQPDAGAGATTNAEGKATLVLPAGPQFVQVSFIGYTELKYETNIPSEGPIVIRLTAAALESGEAVIASNRANRTMEAIPSRVEVLTDEVEEAATMDPARIAHLLLHTTGVQVQQQSAASGSASIRIQGAYGRYAQVLKDGFPLYGGLTGGLGVLQIPPLDLKQVEFVKGSASTLYGAGAISGLINLVSRTPDSDQTTLHINGSHLGHRDINSFVSRRAENWGLTVFTSANQNPVFDANDDGFSDLPSVRKFNLNPTLFLYPSEKWTVRLGATLTQEERKGGDVFLVEGGTPDTEHLYVEAHQSEQFTTQFEARFKASESLDWTLRNSTNRYDRTISLTGYSFQGTHVSTYSELGMNLRGQKHQLSAGLNGYTDRFDEKPAVWQERDFNQSTAGAYAQYLFDPNAQWTLEAGLRTDGVLDYGLFVLPRIAALYKPGALTQIRVSAGAGYKLPTLFTADTESLAFEGVAPLGDNLQAETSNGLQADVGFHIPWGDRTVINLNVIGFYNAIENALVLDSIQDQPTLVNTDQTLVTQGAEVIVKASREPFHLYAGYTFVQARFEGDHTQSQLPLTPEHAVHADVMYVVEGKWRMGFDAEYESTQLLSSGRTVQALFKAGFLAERTFNRLSVYVNFENFTDTRQSRYDASLLDGITGTTRYTEVWAPLEGFIFSAGCKWKFE